MTSVTGWTGHDAPDVRWPWTCAQSSLTATAFGVTFTFGS